MSFPTDSKMPFSTDFTSSIVPTYPLTSTLPIPTNRSTSHDGSDEHSSPGSTGMPMFDLDYDHDQDDGDDDLVGQQSLPKQVASQVGPVKKSRRPPSTAERKATHNAVERARRESLNGRFMELATALPTMAHVKRPSKAIIVNKSLEYIYDSRARETLLVKENDLLRSEINELRARLNIPSIPLPPRTTPVPITTTTPIPIVLPTTASSTPRGSIPPPTPNTSGNFHQPELDSTFAAYAHAAHTHAQAQARAQAQLLAAHQAQHIPIVSTELRQRAPSTTNSVGGSPRSVGSAPELAGAYFPTSTATSTSFFANYAPVSSTSPASNTVRASNAPSPTSDESPKGQNASPPAQTQQDLFSLANWSRGNTVTTPAPASGAQQGQFDVFGSGAQGYANAHAHAQDPWSSLGFGPIGVVGMQGWN